MAASVENRQFIRLESGLGKVPGIGFVKSSHSRPDSPIRNSSRSFTSTRSSSLPATKHQTIDPDTESESEDDELGPQWPPSSVSEAPILDPRDEGTADSWVKRHPSLIRLTGKHPFNCEPPLPKLMQHGFITPAPLHYVRNHGPVPKGTWDEWSVEVSGLVSRPTKLTMDQIVNDFAPHEFPVTLVCAGNRRKEQNMVKQTVGFNWGASGISTSVWRGAHLRDVLKRCGIMSRKCGALYVYFEGAEDLPGGGGSKYGTSLRRELAMDPVRDIILAYKQNGAPLGPDHGYPVRMIIPGFIGGRMVKWLRRIVVTEKESENHYHYKDNRVLPSHVDAELANAEGWWYKPEYIINELNINSVITTPSHEEILPINSATTQRPYTMRGYAYSGGGKKVTRVEVTTDGGETWLLCSLDHPERPNRYGKYWCWCFWSLELEVLDLLATKEIAVRAWDETHNTQPEKLNWNVMGMMNNCWFKVKTNICRPHKGEIGLVFEHPTQPGSQSGGWMARQKHLETFEEAKTLKKSVSSPFMNTASKSLSMSEVQRHSTAESAWIVVHRHVYDCTKFLKDHPGGADSILINAGTDCTDEFDAIHSDKAKSMLESYRIGELITTGYASSSSADNSPNTSVHGASNFSHLATISESSVSRPVALVPRAKTPCTLTSKIILSDDSRLFRFSLPTPDHVLGLPTGKHLMVSAKIEGKLCIRSYTPTSPPDQVGSFDLLIKVYFKGVHPNFPNGGLMSQYLESLPLGSIVDIKGPVGHIEYTGRGGFTVGGKHRQAKRLTMLAGGTGITPIYQVMQAILKDPEDHTEMHLVYANRREEDILLRTEIDKWAREDSRLKVWYVLSNPKDHGWSYSVGYITEGILREHIPGGSDDTLALICGPSPMIQFAVLPNLEKMDYDVKNSCLLF
ncbi:hypothetical protein AMTRI_Chr04g182700 [Amborella trichopoda]